MSYVQGQNCLKYDRKLAFHFQRDECFGRDSNGIRVLRIRVAEGKGQKWLPLETMSSRKFWE